MAVHATMDDFYDVWDCATAALAAIHATMDGRPWSADTLDEIADILRSAGLVIRDPDDVPA